MQLLRRYSTQLRYSPTSIMAALTALEAGTFLEDDWESLKEMP